MTKVNLIGIDSEKANALAESLNNLLSDYQIFYMNARGLHWNIRGDKFFELHLKFEELYNNLILKIDEIAERILTLGSVPLHTYSDYLGKSEIPVVKEVTRAEDAVKSVLDAFRKLLIKQRELVQLSAEANDEGTNALMSDYIREQEKLSWMYAAYLNR
jgi:starvation-inducible DNA-binding protein